MFTPFYYIDISPIIVNKTAKSIVTTSKMLTTIMLIFPRRAPTLPNFSPDVFFAFEPKTSATIAKI